MEWFKQVKRCVAQLNHVAPQQLDRPFVPLHVRSSRTKKTQKAGTILVPAFTLLLQLPIDMDHVSRSGLILHMTDINSFNYRIQNLRRQLVDLSIRLNGRIYFSSLHASGKGLNLLQNIGIKHVVIYSVGFGANLRVCIMVCAQIHICDSFL